MQRGAAVRGVDDLDHRHLDRRRAEHLQALDQIADLLRGPRHDDTPPGERAGRPHPSTSSTKDSQQSVVSRNDSTSTRSSLPWKRDRNFWYVTSLLISPKP